MNTIINGNEEIIISGEIVTVTFHSHDSGYCILKIKENNNKNLITVVGHVAIVQAGQSIQAQGKWHDNSQYGRQFKSSKIIFERPKSIKSLQTYLGSGLIKGIGKHFAKKLIAAFGKDVLDILKNHPEKVAKISGISKKKSIQIQQSLQNQEVISDIMMFLYQHGIGHTRAISIYKAYGHNAISYIEENPYRLFTDIHGIGFKIADKIALSIGIEENSSKRICYALLYMLKDHTSGGHTAILRSNLIEKTTKLLNLDNDIVEKEIENPEIRDIIIQKTQNKDQVCYLSHLYKAEQQAAKTLGLLLKNEGFLPPLKKSIQYIEKINDYLGYSLSQQQYQALCQIFSHKVCILTGGPGVGKTTLVQSVVRILQQMHIITLLCAPTGRAAKRLKEATGKEAKTIHRALAIDPVTKKFLHNKKNPLSIEYCIIDESSMLDIQLFDHVLQALPKNCNLLLVGDVDQLPSVGPGTVLEDLINCQRIPVISLTEIFRQAQTSAIVQYAHSVRKGKMPLFDIPKDKISDCYFINSDNSETTISNIKTLILDRIPKRFGLKPQTQIQILCPMHKGPLGTQTLNQNCQKWINCNPKSKVSFYTNTYCSGDKVMQLKNNYDKDVFNGDIGYIQEIDSENQNMQVLFDDKLIKYHFDELDQIQLAYAISIHKSQGSEFPAVIIPIDTSCYMMLERNLLYTGMTRSRKLLVIVGQKKALHMAINRTGVKERLGFLPDRIHEIFAQ